MKIQEVMETLFAWCKDGGERKVDGETTCDTLKCGNPAAEITRCAVTMFATPKVISAAAAWGANFMIVHEPTFYAHMDGHLPDDPVTAAKEKLLAETGITIWRFHDHPHAKSLDMIHTGALEALGLVGERLPKRRLRLREAITAAEIAARFRALGAKFVRVAGDAETPLRTLALRLGASGDTISEFQDPEIDAVLAGEITEWRDPEYLRDALELGVMHKSLILIGHIASEREGMKFLAKFMQSRFTDFETRYFECGEPWA